MRLYSIISRFSTLSMSKRTADVLLLKGLDKTPYVIIDKVKIEFPAEKSASSIMSKKNIEFYTPDEKTYHPLTQLGIILSDSFYVKYNQTIYYVLRNQNLISSDNNTALFSTYGCMQLQPLINKLIEQAPESTDGKSFHNLILKNVLDYSQPFKLDIMRLKQLLAVTQQHLDNYEQKWRNIEEILRKKADRRALNVCYLIASQILVVNYCVYFYLSWDIMQPITVLLANFDLLIAYYYFVIRRRSFTYPQVSNNYFQNRIDRYMRKHQFDFNRFEELKQIKAYLQFLLTIKGQDPVKIIKVLEGPLLRLNNQ